ncbi:lysylphosphatidylglycerol synthase domain-containing protein [Aetokthonos hydrillicola Thurmond2011]|jgi:hypothetical protein|uniref:Lysylphosphatidylglycerol synthase domain-containing protein n=1 Tax=Aetokthonos hydrillicola Thurmond2011 TaxID=2712845 RepID=A0AAP5M644_9CYAN|nr:lysylphosphatidylglycerol synthase domain-containing protein [Aetokthonos hydrillicola]MBW4585280.1 flippase-like domain-containing protein [Aetokthonos hydrillicola CCALA 1050]MDR9896586.1 lysylphosphatidylglycerol synthase domain-containing protein [Aetokthonos hydrillicola Thurmond2011]
MELKRLTRFGLPLLGLLFFSLSVWAISQQLQQYSIQEILNSLKTAAIKHLLVALGFTVLSYFVLTGYDVLACKYIRHPLPYSKIALAAGTSYAVSNTVGFALFTGSAIRYRLYLFWGVTAVEVAQIIAFANLSFWLGLSAVAGVLFSYEPLAIPTFLHLPFTSVHPLGIVFLALTFGYLLASLGVKQSLRIRSWSISLPSFDIALAQILLASIDWGLAVAVLYVLLPSTPHLSYPAFFGIYLLGQVVGLISYIPGGLGVFETVLLFLLSPPIPPTKIFTALIIYRVIYYFLPLAISVLLLGFYEFKRKKGRGSA